MRGGIDRRLDALEAAAGHYATHEDWMAYLAAVDRGESPPEPLASPALLKLAEAEI